MDFRSGFVSIIGRPNAGKSTLLNALVGEKVAIVTHKPQTTRNRIQGMVNLRPTKGRPAGQIIFIDTPGVHKPESSLNRKMMQEVYDALESRDLILLIVDVTQKFGPGDQFVLDLIKRTGGPVFLLLNKIDLVEKGKLLPLIGEYAKLHDFGP
jgi:GTP-binding protein Era